MLRRTDGAATGHWMDSEGCVYLWDECSLQPTAMDDVK